MIRVASYVFRWTMLPALLSLEIGMVPGWLTRNAKQSTISPVVECPLAGIAQATTGWESTASQSVVYQSLR